jgi:tetratricopeptide (TPR) repeat protein
MSEEKNRDAEREARMVRDVIAAIQLQMIPRAVELARAGLDAGFENPMFLHLRASSSLERNDGIAALADLKRAVEIAPGDLSIRNDYGIVLGRHERWDEAIEILEGSVRQAPRSAIAQFSLGWAREELREFDAARGHYERAAELDPTYVEPLAQLANLAYRRADYPSAKALADRVLAIQPRNHFALTTLANVAIAEGELDKAEAFLQQLIATAPPTPLEGALVNGVLGDLHHAQKRYAQAFSAYTARNRELFALNVERFRDPNSDVPNYCNWLSAQFANASARQWSSRHSAAPDDARDGATGHAFVIGFPRSGTTLLENILASHPAIVTLEERDTLRDLAGEFLLDTAGIARLAALGADEVVAKRALYWRTVERFGVQPDGKFLIDKYPLSAIKLPLVAKLFPKAKVVFALRDPRDVVLSCFRQYFAINASMFPLLHLKRAAQFYAAVMDLVTIYREKFDLDWHELRHESLVADIEGETRKLCDFLGVTWDAKMLEFAEHAKTRAITTPSSIQVVRGLNQDGLSQWRNYEAELAPVMDILAPWVEKFGYR